MHPTRAATVLAAIGALLLSFMLSFQLLSLFLSIARTSLPNRPGNTPALQLGAYRFSFDGTQIFFQQTDPNTPLSGPVWFTMPVDGGPVTRQDPPEKLLEPFQIRQGELYLNDGKEYILLNISAQPEKLVSAALSPDGNALAFSTRAQNGRWNLYIQPTTARIQWLGESDAFIDLEWSPDGKFLVFISPHNDIDQVFTIDRAGQDMRQLTTSPERKSSPHWSPDGNSIAYLATSARHPQTIGKNDPTQVPLIVTLTPTLRPGVTAAIPSRTDVFLINADGSDVRQITDSPEQEIALAWVHSSHGVELAFAARQADNPQAAFLYGADPASGSVRQVYPPVAISDFQCPSEIPYEQQADVRATFTNTALVPLDLSFILRVSDSPIQSVPRSGSATANGTLATPITTADAGARAETVALLPGERRSVAWPVNAAAGTVTYITLRPSPEDPFPIGEQRCSTANTYFGLPSLPVLPLAAPAALIGMLLCIPRLLQLRKPLIWILWAAAPLVFALLVWLEARLVV